MLRLVGVATCAACWLPIGGTPASAQPAGETYPSRLIRFIQPLGPGSPGDIVSRAIADALGRDFGQPTVVENRVGANGILGMDACAKAPPDGYSICVPSFAQMSVNPLLYSKLPYDPLRDQAPVILFAAITSAITISASLGVSSLPELVALAKAKPGKLNWGSWGIGSFSHLYMAWLQSMTGTSFAHIPYKTLGQAVTAVAAGEVDVMVNTPSVAAPLVDAGKVKVLAVIGKERSPLLAAPTLTEAGFALPLVSWVGVTVPTGTPRPIVERLNAELCKLLADPAFVARYLTPNSVAPLGGSPDEFAAFLREDQKTMAQLAKSADMKPLE
jgi:tripartite-type tricarboxylate transporter receptor subunit TctC